MNNDSPTRTMQAFLQEGLHHYSPALVALAEFRREIRTRLQRVLDAHATDLKAVGLDFADLKLRSADIDGPDIVSTYGWIGMRKQSSPELYVGCDVQWDFSEDEGQQVWVGAWVWAGQNKASRDRFCSEFQTRVSHAGQVLFEKSDGSAHVYRYLSPDRFHSLEESFITVVEELVRVLSGLGGIQRFTTAAAD